MPLTLVLATLAHLAAARDSGAICYALEAGRWSRPGFTVRLPARVRLGLERASAGLALSPNVQGNDVRVMPGFPRWRRVGRDSLQLEWSNGFTGVTLLAQVRGRALQGRAETWSDAVGSPQAAALVTGQRTPCAVPRRPNGSFRRSGPTLPAPG